MVRATSGTQEAAQGIFSFLGQAVLVLAVVALVGGVLFLIGGWAWASLANLKWHFFGWFPALSILPTLIAAAFIPEFSTALLVGLGTGLLLTLIFGISKNTNATARPMSDRHIHRDWG